MALRLWKYNTTTGYWKAERGVTPETKDEWLRIFQKDEPTAAFKVSATKPSGSPAKDALPAPIPVCDAFQVTAVGMRKVAEAMRRTFKLQAHNSAVEAENLRREGNSERAKKFLAQEAKWLAMAARSDEAIYREYKGGQATDSQVDTDAAELANAYKTQGEAAARRLWAEKIKGLNYGQQIILQDKMARLIKGKATDATQVPVGFAAGKSPEFRAAEWARRQTELKNSGPLRRPLPGKATDAARLHRALDAAMDARAKGRDTQFSTGERKETPAELAWRAATYEKREEMLKRAGLPDFESGHGWTLLPVDVRKKLNRLYK